MELTELIRERMMHIGPVGIWESVPGSHNALFHSRVHFHSDGNGALRDWSRLQGESLLKFRWRMNGYGQIQCLPQYDDNDSMVSAEEGDWLRLEFVFHRKRTDTGEYWAMTERDVEGFWQSHDALVCISSEISV
jgi:hypothetical protein